MARQIQVARFTADGTEVSRAFDKMGKDGDAGLKKIKDGAKGVPPAMRGIDEAARMAQSRIAGFANSAGPAGNILKAMGPAGIAAATGLGLVLFAFGKLESMAHSAVNALGGVYGAAHKLGVSTDYLQEWRYAVVSAGKDATEADAALTAFATRLGQVSSDIGKTAKKALLRLGFSEDDIHNMHNISDVLPEIADRLHRVSSETERMAIARKLGLDPIAGVLARGSDAFDDVARRAHQFGYVLDSELLLRARKFKGEWAAASAVLDVQMKAAVVDLAPTFIDLAKAIAEASRNLVHFLEQFKTLEQRTSETLHSQIGRDLDRQVELVNRYGRAVTVGGNANSAIDPDHGLFQGGRGTVVDFLNNSNLTVARNTYAFYEQRIHQARDQLRSRTSDGGGDADVDIPDAQDVAAAANALQSYVDQLKTEADLRDRIAAITAQNPSLSHDEAEAMAQQQADIQKLNDARAQGISLTDAEAQRLTDTITARYAEAAATKAQAEAERQAQQAEQAHAQLIQQVETPLEKLNREISELQSQALQNNLPDDLVQRRIDQLTQSYEDMAAAQREASFEGQVLTGIFQGQVQSLADVEKMLIQLAANDVLKELLATGLNGPGGIGGFASRTLGRITSDLGIGGKSQNGGVAALNQAATQAASSLARSLAPSVATSAAKVVLSSTATNAETGARAKSTGGIVEFILAADKATLALNALAAAAASAGGSSGTSSFVSNISQAITGGGHAAGGPIYPGARYPGAEHGTEIAVFGGWAQIASHNAMEGLALLGRLSRAPAAAPGAGMTGIRVELKNESGHAIEASEADSFLESDGVMAIRVAIRRQTVADVGAGHFDDVMKSRFNASPRRIRRG